MVYLDYSATTPVSKEVLDSYSKCCLEYVGNPNSLHSLGTRSKMLMDQATNQVASLFGCKSSEVIFTSGASESNNLALVGITDFYRNRGKHIITTELEHSSILETVKYLEKKGFIIDYVPILENGLVDLEALSNLITKETILVSICHVNSEIGICQPIDKIAEIVKKCSTTIFHVDGTQAVGKIPISLENVDLYSFSAHKFFGMKGIGGLIKKEKVQLEPIIHGGKSQTNYRSGTPPLPLIVSLAKALRLATSTLDEDLIEVQKKCQILKDKLTNYPHVVINSNEYSIPHIVNISIPGIKSETFLHALEQYEIYVSTKTACSKDSSKSLSLTAMRKNDEIASSSLRISISKFTTDEELEYFIKCFDKCLNQLSFMKRD